jgi:hypothetical protein
MIHSEIRAIAPALSACQPFGRNSKPCHIFLGDHRSFQSGFIQSLSRREPSDIFLANVPDDQSPLASGVLPAREADQQEA